MKRKTIRIKTKRNKKLEKYKLAVKAKEKE